MVFLLQYTRDPSSEEKLMNLALDSVDLPSGLGVGVILVHWPNLQARREQVSLAFLHKVHIVTYQCFPSERAGWGRRDDTGVLTIFKISSLFSHPGVQKFCLKFPRRTSNFQHILHAVAGKESFYLMPVCGKFVCVEVLRPSQPNGVMSSAVSLPNHTFTGQA